MVPLLLQVFFIIGEFALVVIKVALPAWRSQFTAGAVLCALSLLLWFLVPESGRWLQVQGRGEEAYQVRPGRHCSKCAHILRQLYLVQCGGDTMLQLQQPAPSNGFAGECRRSHRVLEVPLPTWPCLHGPCSAAVHRDILCPIVCVSY